MKYEDFIASDFYKINTLDISTPDLSFTNKDKIYECLEDILLNDRSVYVYGDYDADGICSARNWVRFLNKFNYNKFKVYEYTSRTHSIDKGFVKDALSICPDYVIINDAGSGDLLSLNALTRNGIKVILLDHHMSFDDYSKYPDNCYVVNTTIENKLLGEDKYRCCSGALVYLVLKEFMDDRDIKSTDMAVLGLASLYADCMLMSNPINRYVYSLAIQATYYDIPEEVNVFMLRNQNLSRRFFEFTWAPKINSAFRSEQLEVLNKTILNRSSRITDTDIAGAYTEIHTKSRTLVDSIVDLIEVFELNNFVYGNLNSVDKYINVIDNKLYNYTGLVANRLSSKYDKACVIVCYTGTSYKGSLRDRGGRDFLSVFETFCSAGGHPPAFGIHIPKNGFQGFMDSLERVDRYYDVLKIKKPLYIEHDSTLSTEQLLSIARYNEYASSDCPRAFIKVKVDDLKLADSRSRKSKFYYGANKINSDRKTIKTDYILVDVYYTGNNRFSLEAV